MPGKNPENAWRNDPWWVNAVDQQFDDGWLRPVRRIEPATLVCVDGAGRAGTAAPSPEQGHPESRTIPELPNHRRGRATGTYQPGQELAILSPVSEENRFW